MNVRGFLRSKVASIAPRTAPARVRGATLPGIMYAVRKSQGMEAMWKGPYATKC
jgi:hypothetical protein